MLAVPKQKFLERIDVLPEALRSVVFSTETGALLSFICKNHHLDDEKSNAVIILAAAVLLGFLHHTDLAKEIQDDTGLDVKIAQSVADEIKQKVLFRVQADIDRIYEPALESEVIEETAVPAPTRVETTSTPAAHISFSVPFSFAPHNLPANKVGTPAVSETHAPSTGPLMLHEEKPISGEARRGFKGFSIPLGFLRSKVAPETPKVAARVEIPGSEIPVTSSLSTPPPSLKKDAVRTVHYNELRTPLSPFGQREEFINLETFEKFSPPPSRGKSEGAATAPLVPSTPEVPAPSATGVPPQAPMVPSESVGGPPTAKSLPPTPAEPPVMHSAETPVLKTHTLNITETPLPSPPVPAPAPEGGEPKLKGNVVDLR